MLVKRSASRAILLLGALLGRFCAIGPPKTDGAGPPRFAPKARHLMPVIYRLLYSSYRISSSRHVSAQLATGDRRSRGDGVIGWRYGRL